MEKHPLTPARDTFLSQRRRSSASLGERVEVQRLVPGASCCSSRHAARKSRHGCAAPARPGPPASCAFRRSGLSAAARPSTGGAAPRQQAASHLRAGHGELTQRPVPRIRLQPARAAPAGPAARLRSGVGPGDSAKDRLRGGGLPPTMHCAKSRSLPGRGRAYSGRFQCTATSHVERTYPTRLTLGGLERRIRLEAISASPLRKDLES